jgi:hypothetical protein
MNHRTARLNRQLGAYALVACWVLASVGFLSGTLLAQGTKDAPAAEQAQKIQVAVNELILPVVVRDKSGHAVGGLVKDQFQVLDRGKLRSIAGFHIERRSREGTAADVGPSERSPRNDASPETSATRRFIVILFDNRHMEEAELLRARVGQESVGRGAGRRRRRGGPLHVRPE